MNTRIFILAIIYLMCFNVELQAQESDQPRTLFSGANLENTRFMIATDYAYTQMDGADASLLNIRAGVILQEQFTVGAFYGFSINDIDPKSETLPNVYMDFRSYGGFAAYTLRPSQLVHFTFPLFIGAGEVEMDNEEGSAGLGEENFFLIEPGAMLELNLHKNIRFNVGATYRFIGDMSYRNMNQEDIAGFTGRIGVKFGVF